MTLVASSQTPVGTGTPTKIVAAIPAGQQVLIANRDATNSFYVGAANVTTGTGVEVKANSLLAQGWLELPPETELYAVSAAGTPRCDVLAIEGT